ncbi:chaperone EMC4 [Paracoccidioides brasiliensis Pb18]|uniref:ER membrane protein complex subunit 4 n=2 Tax=Paracoccidioides brasiliensis TaxID=121759 RepID=C1G0G1_PARBD|nr:chaperone EMC4 [Paracoccidioides brasiliensis Pb18]EEH44062.2 hypothetical protein PADG_00351 [Paracoccidioides brasiliensis Pb18]ODH44903.1 hypothetical protein ACO22_00598 [Paracoccidioides brasiliensis]ODH50750.1 hypothetical protein GX48_03066 [Paracoccidioides brasiliensis]
MVPPATPPPLPRWVIDINASAPPRPSKTADIPNPPGYTPDNAASKHSAKQQRTAQQAQQQQTPSSSAAAARKVAETDALKLKKAWEIALAPSKQLPMNAIMMYMSGNSLQIFSIMMVFMLFKGPIQGLLNTNSAFTKFETESTKGQMWGVKAVYVLMQCVLLALGVWKVNGMGLLPTTRSDWLAWETERQPLERAYFAFR